MDLIFLERMLKQGRVYIQDGIKYEIDDKDRVIVTRVDKDGNKIPGRPSIWGFVMDNTRIKWAKSAEDFELDLKKMSKKEKTTIGTYVTPDEYELIQKAAASISLTAGSFVRQVAVKAAKAVLLNDRTGCIDNINIIFN